jgi:hypothetical protein
VVTDATFGDNCPGSTISYTLSGATVALSTSGQVGTYTFNKGVTTIDYLVTDAAGLTVTGSKTVTVTDNEKPVLTPAANQNINLNSSCSVTIPDVRGTATDNCAGTVITQSPAIGSTQAAVHNQTINVTVTATDAAGNTDIKTVVLTAKDVTNPTISCPAYRSVNVNSGSCVATVATIAPTRADNCAVTKLTWTLTGATSGSSPATGINDIGSRNFNLGTTTVTYRVEDIAGNFATCSYTITVIDNIPPALPSLPTINEQCSVTVVAPTTTDNCDTVVTGTTVDPLTYTQQGTYTIHWTFSDASNNVTTANQTVIVRDTTGPVPDIATLPTINEGCSLASITPPTATDGCTGQITGTTTTVFPITTQGTTVVTWTFVDGNGNTTTQTQNVVLTKPPISGGSLTGYISDIVPLPAPSTNIAIASCHDPNPITLNLNGAIGTIVRWEKYEAGDTVWSAIPNTNNTHNIEFFFNNTKSTLFRVLVQVGTCFEYSNMVNVHAIPPDVPPILDQDNFVICLNDDVTLVARSGYVSTVNVGEGGDFNAGQFPDKWNPTQWKIDGKVAGAQWTAAADATKFNNWSGVNDSKNIGTNYIIKYDNGKEGKKFGIAHGNFNSSEYITKYPGRGGLPTTLETPIFSLEGLTTASIDFDQAFNLHEGDYAKLELSLDGGLTYTVTLQELIGKNPPLTWNWSANPPSTSTNYVFNNDNSSFDISAYIGNDNVRVRWSFFGTTDESVWAIDNIQVPVKPYSNIIEWTDGLGEPGQYIIRNELNATYVFKPQAPGVHQYGATTLVNGCRAYDPAGTAFATVAVNYAYAGQDYTPLVGECGGTTVALNAYDNTLTANQNAANGAFTLPAGCTNCDDPGTQAPGQWSIVSSPGTTCGTASFTSSNPALYPDPTRDPRATFSGQAGTYILRWTVAGCTDDVSVTLRNCDVIDFDGTDDYIAFKNNYNLGNAFTIEMWIKPEAQPAGAPSTIQSLISKRNANSLTSGYDLRLVGNTLTFNVNNGSPITSPFPINTDRWYHIAVTYGSGTYKIYVDGIEVISITGSAPSSNSQECIVGAMDQAGNPPNKPVNHYSGWMDELRIWNRALHPHHIRQMMNQEINANGTAVRGAVVPIDINGPDADNNGVDDDPLLWSNLIGYYRMNQIDCGYLKPFEGKGVDGKLRNITTAQDETAPLPYYTVRDGDWTNRTAGITPWRWGATVWDYPNSTGYNNTKIDWNIVRTSHNINTTAITNASGITLMGLISDTPGKLIKVVDPTQTPDEFNNGQMLWITHYLKLAGNIDLVGESQLLQRRFGYLHPISKEFVTDQFSESILDADSPGYVERDQQGTQSSYNYNYWSSPVSYQGAVTNNAPFSVAQMLMDGTDSQNPNGAGPINFGNWVKHADFALTYPIKLSNYWLWKHNGTSGIYEEWKHIGSTGLVYPGEGYTMKGTSGFAAIAETQNYVFRGKPNNGTLTLSIMAGNNRLIGNPYPSAIDANEFIKDNIKDSGGRNSDNVINGTLYFWDHFSGHTHNLAEYIGGYATYTLMGGSSAISNDYRINASGATGTKVPERFIAVSQGFFVNATLDAQLGDENITSPVVGGDILFRNNQRAFQREKVTGLANEGSVHIRTMQIKTKKPGNVSTEIP